MDLDGRVVGARKSRHRCTAAASIGPTAFDATRPSAGDSLSTARSPLIVERSFSVVEALPRDQ